MLQEEKNVRQIPGDPRRRWFCDEYFDLIVWFEPDDSIWGFQLCYDRERKHRALTWTKKNGYKHTGVDDGESVYTSGSKGSPVLTADGLFDSGAVGDKLEKASAALPREIAAFVLEKVRAHKL